MTNPIRRRVERLEATQPSSAEPITCIQLRGVVPGGGEGHIAMTTFDDGRWPPFAIEAHQCLG